MSIVIAIISNIFSNINNTATHTKNNNVISFQNISTAQEIKVHKLFFNNFIAMLFEKRKQKLI